MPAVLFVCTGNLYRSPISEALFKAMLAEEQPDASAWRVKSAGTWAQANQPAPPEVVQVMAKRGLDLKSHRSRMVSAEILAEFDLILTMESGQKEALCIEFPQFAEAHLHAERDGGARGFRSATRLTARWKG